MKTPGLPIVNSYVCASCRRTLATARRRSFATSSSKPTEIYDIVAVGGGPVGLALLAALSKSLPSVSRNLTTEQLS